MAIGYHFTSDTLRDGSSIPPIGVPLIFKGDLEICHQGYHGSDNPFDALLYAPGSLLHLVEYDEVDCQRQPDKWCSRKRTILKTINFESQLRRFAADQALKVIHLWPAPEVVKEYLITLDESKRNAAWDFARNAAWDSARNAAWDSARNAAWYAASDAAKAAARNAAWYAAWNAAKAAAWYAASDAAKAAARNAAWNAAWDSAWAAAKSEFKLLVDKSFEEV